MNFPLHPILGTPFLPPLSLSEKEKEHQMYHLSHIKVFNSVALSTCTTLYKYHS